MKIRNKPDFSSHVHVDNVRSIILIFIVWTTQMNFGSEINISQNGRMHLFYF